MTTRTKGFGTGAAISAGSHETGCNDIWTNTKTPKSHNNTNKQNNRGYGKTATPVSCEVKLLFMSKESDSFEEGSNGSVAPWKALYEKIHLHKNPFHYDT